MHITFDIVIPVGPNDVQLFPTLLTLNKKNISGYRNIYLISYDKNLHIDGCVTIDEDRFPFTKKSITDFFQVAKFKSSAAWYLQQLLKLYAHKIIPGLSEYFLILDADVAFIKETRFFDKNGKILLRGVPLSEEKFHSPYFESMEILHPTLTRVYQEYSGVADYMMVKKEYIQSMIDMIENFHKNKFYICVLKSVNEYHNHIASLSGFSEYELIFNYMLQYFPNKVFIHTSQRHRIPASIEGSFKHHFYIAKLLNANYIVNFAKSKFTKTKIITYIQNVVKIILKKKLRPLLPFAKKIIKSLTGTTKPQIFVHTMGGLGNQLYQYAFGKAYELKYGVKVNFISLFFWNKYVREVLFYRFTKNHQALGYHNGFCLDVFKTRNFNIVWNNIRYWFNLKAQNIIRYNENECNIKPEIAMPDGKNVLFFGYFADVSLFNEYRGEILKDLTLRHISGGAKIWEEKIKNTKNSASVHIRRGDYVINPIVRNSSVCLSEDSNYYNLAIKHIKDAIGDDVNLFIFSDDLPWVRENMKFDGKNIEYVEFKDQKKNSHEDIYLMSLCQHNITANSTFSWWSGWLNKRKDKIVTAPFAWTKKDGEFVPIDKGLIYDDLALIKYTKTPCV